MEIIKPDWKWNGKLFPLTRITKLVQHHMAHPNWNVHEVHEFHRDTKGWAGIGYNYWIGFDGTIYEGRGLNKGAHAGSSWNPRSIGIGYQGDFTKQEMTDKQLESGAWLNFKLIRDHNLSVADIVGHRQVSNTECPGTYFRMKELKDKVQALISPEISNGIKLNMKWQSSSGVLINGKVYFPVREFFEDLGFEVGWNPDSQTVTIIKQEGE